tara:strand:+ start:11845 stop:13221 length:1377 start_codon:yes stop_codon:yes gene_type:complete
MADIKINDLTAYTDPVSTDVLPIVDVGNDLTKKVSIADLLENAGTGSAAAPSFSFDGDNDTGIYRPGADQVALTAGGTQALLAESTGITIPGNLTVSGTTTTVDTVNLTVKDKNIELGVVSTPSNTTADGGGITLKGATDKTINWVDSTDAWTLSEHINIASAKEYRIAGTKVLDATSLGSALLTDSTSSTSTTTAATPNSVKTSFDLANAALPKAGGTLTGDLTIPDKIIHSGDTNTFIRFPAADTFSVDTAGSERMRIQSSGSVGIGTSSPAGKLEVNFNSSVDVGLVLKNSTTGTSARFYSGSSIVGSITVTGSATAYNTSSDYRLKENVVNIADGITRVKQLIPKRFNFIVDADTTVDGFLAHEAQIVVPEAVTGGKDATKEEEYVVTPAVEEVVDESGNVTTAAVDAVMGTRTVPDHQVIDQSKLVPLLTAALQEAITKIETLEQRLSDAGIA